MWTQRKRHPAFVAANWAAALGALLLPLHAAGQVSSAGKTVFKCETAGRVVYTDAPCTDAQKVDALRIYGVNAPAAERPTNSGDERLQTGSIQPWRRVASEHSYAMRRALQGSNVNPECPHLAQRMARVEAEEQTATSQSIGLIQERLAVQRHWYRQLGCAADMPEQPSYSISFSNRRVPGYPG